MSEPRKVAIVTGGSRGIGKAIVETLIGLDYDVAFNYVKSADQANAIVEQHNNKKTRCQTSQVDIADFETVKQWIDEVKKEFGQIDVLINNAGITKDKSLMMMSPQDWQQVMETNLTGMYNASKACIVSFMKQKSGRIINISSISGIIGLVGQSNYSATKGGMNAFTKALAKEVARYQITVNAIAPGFINTDILNYLSEEDRKAVEEQVPMKMIGSPKDVAQTVAFLLSDYADYVTGQIIRVDGGLAMR